MLEKPVQCDGCSLQFKGQGFALHTGPPDSVLCFVGEALGEQEAYRGEPFVGPAGSYLNRALETLGMTRGQVRIGNVVNCRPPNNWMVGSPWEHSAINHCNIHRTKLYRPGVKVYIALGTTATRTLLSELTNQTYGGKLDNWHGTHIPCWTGAVIVPTYHPSYLMQGQQRLLGTFYFDLRRAMELASFGPNSRTLDLVVDPPAEWFSRWLDQIGEEAWLAVDIETTWKTGEQEDELQSPGGDITRVNFAVNPDQGLTVPWDQRYIPLIQRALSLPCAKAFWNERFDVPILTRAGTPPAGIVLDFMLGWHVLQSSLPQGLGFVTPFYAPHIGPWKHLSSTEPGRYAAIDAAATLHCAFGIAKDLASAGQWDTFLRYVADIDRQVLHPCEDVGLLVDDGALRALSERLRQEEKRIDSDIQQLVPEELKPLLPKSGWKRHPGNRYPGQEVVEQRVKEMVRVCTQCGEAEVSSRHKCQ